MNTETLNRQVQREKINIKIICKCAFEKTKQNKAKGSRKRNMTCFYCLSLYVLLCIVVFFPTLQQNVG